MDPKPSQSPNRVQLRCVEGQLQRWPLLSPRLNPLTGSNCGVSCEDTEIPAELVEVSIP